MTALLRSSSAAVDLQGQGFSRAVLQRGGGEGGVVHMERGGAPRHLQSSWIRAFAVGADSPYLPSQHVRL